jgi:hypothetical protein
MPIYVPEIVTERGKEDARRHREKQKELIRKKLPAIIAQETIITAPKGKIVKVPIKNLEIPYFRGGKGGKEVGIGQGQGKQGDIINRRPGDKGKADKPGREPGVDYIESEMELAELIEFMLEDLGLPNLKEKSVKKLLVELGWKLHGHSKSGPWVLLDRRKTAKAGMKRFWSYLHYLELATGRDRLTCFSALRQAKGILRDAIQLLQNSNFSADTDTVVPFTIFERDDFSFYKLQKNIRPLSRAVVISMLDVSGSMGTQKKYLVRSLLFWLVAFLREIYAQVEVRFIVHHTQAKIVDEETAFRIGESGGTLCYTAYELANHLVETEYPTHSWNVYVWHFSDGEDFEPRRTVEEITKLLSKNVNMVAYGEVKPREEYTTDTTSELSQALRQAFPMQDMVENDLRIFSARNLPFLEVVIREKGHLWPALKQFLKKDRWQEVKL